MIELSDPTRLVTPVHVFSAADEAELFLNGKSVGKVKKETSNYRFRWDDIQYEAGELHVVTYKNGQEWANDTVRTTGIAAQLRLTADRAEIKADGYDLSFLTLEVVDERGDVIPQANNTITFSVSSGEGEIIATDNGDPYDMVPFPFKERKAFSGMALTIVRAGTKGACHRRNWGSRFPAIAKKSNDEVIKSTRAMKAWKSPLAEKWWPHVRVTKNLARYHSAGAQRAQGVIDDSIKTRTVPDFELFIIEITDFIARVGGTSSRPSKEWSRLCCVIFAYP
ncbi:uncharacterized protein DNG_09264 [Cephalotrichum gorgonifer]|uniref:Beta-galactosidase n=1 Tax=Cephalotrichum gorgonifer TaxID=2041049 RepID=A0AAE8N6Y9_9PEZI|nr:uncharacterized protein DNG_09264 [Cephalotrichum gorgonifer]